MPELVTPDGTPVAADDAKRAEINQDFSRAMAAEDPSGTPAPPVRQDKPGPPPRRRGRPSKDEKARADSKPAGEQKSDKDYTEPIAGLTTLAWAACASVPYTQPYAAVIDANQSQLVAALNGAAQNNARAREVVEKLAAGGGGVWMIQLAAVGTNMAMQTLELLKSPDLRKEAAAATQHKFRSFLKTQGVNVPGDGQDAPAEVPSAPAAA